MKKIKFVDLFCGLGGIRIAFENAIKRHNLSDVCIHSSDIKKSAVITYERNFGEKVGGDLCLLNTADLGNFDVLLAGFPCQAFSNAGKRGGFNDLRGTLFFQVARVLKDKKPKAFILENVAGLVDHDHGETLRVILKTLKNLNYGVKYEVLSSDDFGLAQRRKRIYIVGVYGASDLDLAKVFDFSENSNQPVVFGDIREYGLPVKNTKFNFLAKKHFKDLTSLYGKNIRDKRCGPTNIHSWDLGLRGKVTLNQKTILDQIALHRRNKKWSVENNVAWFEDQAISLNQIRSFINLPGLKEDLDVLVGLKYLKRSYPKDFMVVDNKKIKVERKDLFLGYEVNGGKLSFEYGTIISDLDCVGTITATDGIKLGVVEKNGLRNLSSVELKRLFGFPVGYKTDHLSESDLFNLFGNSVVINVLEEILFNLLEIIK